jgi:hypothetical protein
MRPATRVAYAAVLLVFMRAAACDSGGTECLECPSTGLTLNLPAPLVGQVISIETSEGACVGAVVQPSVDAGASRSATQFHVQPTQAGQCQIVIIFADGTSFSDQLLVVETTGCCAGLHTSPLGAAAIDVPSPFDGGGGDE